MFPEDKHIESAWKTAFDEAAISPSKNLWEGLESVLAEQQETATWQNAFANAETAPTPELWEKIETELNRKKKRPFLFWLNSNTIKIAAGVLLMVGVYQFGLYQLSFTSKELRIAQSQKDTKETRQSVTTSEQDNKAKRQQVVSNQQIIAQSQEGNKAIRQQGTGNQEIGIGITPIDPILLTQNIATIEKNVISKLTNASNKGVRLNQQRIPTHQIKWEAIAYQMPQKRPLRLWVGFSSGTSSFNPSLNFSGVQSAAAPAFTNSDIFNESMLPTTPAGKTSDNNFLGINAPKNESMVGAALQFGILAGTQLGKKTSFETGIQVLKGNSTFRTNTFLIDRQTSQKNNLYAFGASESPKIDVATQAVGVVLEPENLPNNYTFLQVPFRLGYQLFQKEKVGLIAFGGISADVFMINRFGDNILQNKNAYKSVNASALLAMRANYKLYDRWYWNTSLNYQHSLSPNNKSGALIGMKMKLAGLSMGLQYKF